MYLGYNSNGFAHHRLGDTLTILAELGYEGVGLTLDYHVLNPYDLDLAAQTGLVRGLLEKNHLRCVIETGARFLLDPRRKHQPTLISALPIDRERRLDFLFRAVDIARELGAPLVSCWSGAAPEGSVSNEIMSRLAESCRRLADYAGAIGVTIAFEPEPGMFVDTLAGFEELNDRVDHERFRLTIDIGHLHCQGEIPISAHLERWAGLLVNVHIEDMRRGRHDHLMFGEGEIDFASVLGTLADTGYAGGVFVELSRHSHDAVSTAGRSLEFLRRVLEGK